MLLKRFPPVGQSGRMPQQDGASRTEAIVKLPEPITHRGEKVLEFGCSQVVTNELRLVRRPTTMQSGQRAPLRPVQVVFNEGPFETSLAVEVVTGVRSEEDGQPVLRAHGRNDRLRLAVDSQFPAKSGRSKFLVQIFSVTFVSGHAVFDFSRRTFVPLALPAGGGYDEVFDE